MECSQEIAASTGSRSVLAPDGVDTLTERLAIEQRDRDERLERARRESEAAQLKECTFAPQVAAGLELTHSREHSHARL